MLRFFICLLLGSVVTLPAGAQQRTRAFDHLRSGFPLTGAHQAARLQFVLDRTGRQKRQTMAFNRHRLQTFGHVGLVDCIELERRVGLLGDHLDQAP